MSTTNQAGLRPSMAFKLSGDVEVKYHSSSLNNSGNRISPQGKVSVRCARTSWSRDAQWEIASVWGGRLFAPSYGSTNLKKRAAVLGTGWPLGLSQRALLVKKRTT